MNYEQFCHWLKGRVDFSDSPPTKAEWKRIVDELQKAYTQAEAAKKAYSNKSDNPSLKEMIDRFNKDQATKPLPPTPPIYYLGSPPLPDYYRDNKVWCDAAPHAAAPATPPLIFKAAVRN